MADDYFQILGVPRRYHLDVAALEKIFHELSRATHPDRHAKADPQTRVKTALAATELNTAYRTLKAAVPRAEYLLRLEGFEIKDERGGHKVDPGFLMDILELREALLEARVDRDAAKVAALASEVRRRRDEVLARLDAALAAWEQTGAREDLVPAADALVSERYFRRFLEEVEAFEDARLDGEA